MPTDLGWQDIVIRLALTIVAGALIGWDRVGHGRPAGLRTTLLVCLAASVAMIQTNLLLATAGRHPDSFIMLDLMRLPLGILSGMGFIGGGVILKRDDIVLGVTTAATLWFVTVVGLCFGGGQIALGLGALGIGLLVLSPLRRVEERMRQDHRATLVLSASHDGPTEDDLRRYSAAAGIRVVHVGLSYNNAARTHELRCELHWRAKTGEDPHPALVRTLAQLPGVLRVQSTPLGMPAGTN